MVKKSGFKRKLIQLYSALLYNAHLRGWVDGKIFTGSTKAVCVPGLNCYSCPGAVGACPLGALQNALGSLNKNIGFYVLGIILLFGMSLGRTVCGWLCPVGLIQELLHKIPTPKIPKSRFTRALSYLKYVILVIFVLIIPIYYGLLKGIPVPGFCKFICPAGTAEGAVGLLPNNPEWLSMLGAIFTEKFIIMVIIGLACIFCYRSFCRFLCPLGAIYGLFNRLSVIGVKLDGGCCNNCGACVRNCRMDVVKVGDRECIHCGECIAHCHQKALSFKAGKISLPLDKRKETAAWSVAIIALIAVMIWSNFLDPSLKETKETKTYDEVSDTPVGYEVGDRLADFEAVCLDGSKFSTEQNRGRVVVINLWATYCGPCIEELPYFMELKDKYKEDVAILAVHPYLTTEDVGAYVKEKGWDLQFTIDDENESIFKLVNGGTALPQTIVLNRKGEVIFNRVGSITGAELEQLYQEASKGQEPEGDTPDDVPAVEKDEEITSGYTCENADGVYRIRVVDDEMKPVEGAMVQYCTDIYCKMAVTDKDGCITFDDPPAEYEVHILKVPEGYDKNTDTYKTLAEYSDMVIVVERE